MKNIYILFFFLLSRFNKINICCASLKYNSNHKTNKNKVKNRFEQKNSTKHSTKRKLDEFYPLKIFLDTAELNYTCHPLQRFLDNIVKAMYNAKNQLEQFILISPYTSGFIDIVSKDPDGNVLTNLVEDDFRIVHHASIFNDNFWLTDYNYFIFGKCVADNLNEESASVILNFQERTPFAGIVLFNINSDYLNNIDESKFTENYLTALMLHHFVRLLGFNAALSSPQVDHIPNDGGYYLKTEGDYNFDNVINYAKEYFNCPDIDRIDLYVDDENLDNSGDYYQYAENDIVGLYWPKALFSGELLTKFDYSEGHFLSGFTLAFLDDLPYLQVTKQYAGDIVRFGKNNGCQCKCEYFNDQEHINDFWDCTACMDGYFLALESSGTKCVNNNNKKYYFLYNEESQLYRKCELEISNCQTCSSQTQCTSCFKGYELEQENGKPTCKEEDNGLSAGAIVGIVIGCICFLAIIAIIIIYILKKRNNEKEGGKEEEIPENKNRENIEQNEKNTIENGIKVVELNKNNEIMDSEANQKRMISEEKNIS